MPKTFLETRFQSIKVLFIALGTKQGATRNGGV